MSRETSLDNQFYRLLLNEDLYRQQLQDNSGSEVFSDRFLWRRSRGPNLFMLNADMALIANMGDFIDPDSGEVTCTLGQTCPASNLRDFAGEFANNNNAWMRAFHDAYLKMTAVGCNDSCRPVV